MTHDELLAKIDSFTCCSGAHELALRAVVELCKEYEGRYHEGEFVKILNQAIEKELG